jgi:hypothetical protein
MLRIAGFSWCQSKIGESSGTKSEVFPRPCIYLRSATTFTYSIDSQKINQSLEAYMAEAFLLNHRKKVVILFFNRLGGGHFRFHYRAACLRATHFNINL